MRALVLVLCVLRPLSAAGAQPLRESYLNAAQLIQRHGYQSEEHEVVTDDGYRLTLHRIPHGRSSSATLGPPVLLQHGILSASDLWVMSPPDKSLAFILADQGYDVWLGNVRGNFYCRKHVNMSADLPAFWDFSFHEHGVLDLAATMDHVLATSGQPGLFYVGHSMGATMYYVLMSMRPQYNARVRLMVSMAPAVFLGHMRVPGLRLALQHRDAVSRLLDRLGVRELLPRTPLVQRMAEQYCGDNSATQPFCVALLVLVYGNDLQQLNKTALPNYVSHGISGCSKKTLAHFSQIAGTGRFQQYDYGPAGNLKRYGTRQPPEYPLHQVTAPCSLHYGDGDLLMTRADLVELQKRLPRAVGMFKVPHSKFNHIDFIVALDIYKLLYRHVLDIMTKF